MRMQKWHHLANKWASFTHCRLPWGISVADFVLSVFDLLFKLQCCAVQPNSTVPGDWLPSVMSTMSGAASYCSGGVEDIRVRWGPWRGRNYKTMGIKLRPALQIVFDHRFQNYLDMPLPFICQLLSQFCCCEISFLLFRELSLILIWGLCPMVTTSQFLLTALI